jgi:hypothetical protein
MPLAHYTAELIFGLDLQRWQSRQDKFSLGAEVGRTFADHAMGMYASGNPYVLSLGVDYSGFDSTETWSSMRRWMVEGIKMGLKARGIDTMPFGKWKSLVEVADSLWTRLCGAYFQVEDLVFSTDMLNSGEYLTIIINNMKNDSTLSWIDSKQSLQGFDRLLKLVDRKLMGDDSISFYEIIPGNEPSTDDLTRFIENVSDGAGECGLAVNADKTDFRFFAYSYLKKMAVYGWTIPRWLQLQMICAERVNQQLDFRENIAGHSSLMVEALSRGGSYEFLKRLEFYLGNTKRNVKVKTRDGQSLQPFPFQVLYTPRALNGVGLSSDTMIGANKDALAYYRPGSLREEYNRVSFIGNIKPGMIKAAIAEQVVETDTFKPGIQFQKSVLNDERSRNSVLATARLESHGISVGEMGYNFSPIRIVRAAIKDNPKLEKIVLEEKASKARFIADRIKELDNFKIKNEVFYLWTRTLGEVFDLDYFLRVADGLAVDLIHSYDAYPIDIDLAKESAAKSGCNLVIIGTAEQMSSLGPSAEYVTIVDDQVTFRGSVISINSLIRTLSSGKVSIPKAVEHEFGWLRGTYFSQGEELATVLPVCPVAGLDPLLERMMMQIGVSSGGDSQILKLNKAVLQLISDPYFPADIRAEQIIDMVSKPSIAYDRSRISDSLIAMGAAPHLAANFVSESENIGITYALLRKSSSYSTADQVIGFMDLSIENYPRLVELNIEHPNRSVMGVLKSLGVLYCLTRDIRLPRKKVLIQLSQRSMDTLTKDLIRSDKVLTGHRTSYLPAAFRDIIDG